MICLFIFSHVFSSPEHVILGQYVCHQVKPKNHVHKVKILIQSSKLPRMILYKTSYMGQIGSVNR